MSGPRQWIEKGYFLNGPWLRTLGRALPSLLALMARHPRLVANANRACPDGPENLRPAELPYRIPSYREGMAFCHSDERYLRPTHLCNPREPDIIAMAHELGSFQKPPWAYAESVFRFVNASIRVDFSPPKSALECLRAGHGTCIDKMSLFIALCRAGGIPARYRLYSPQGVQALYDVYLTVDPLLQKWYDTLGFFILHGSAEVKIDGKWVVSDVSGDFYHMAAAGIPIPRFGEDPAQTWIRPAGEVMQPEGLPLGFRTLVGIPFRIFRGTGRSINRSIQANYEKGREVLAKISLEDYDREIRKTYKPRWRESARIASRVLREMGDGP